MPKPIFIVKCPRNNWNRFAENRQELAKEMPDYHILFIPIENTEFQFECYNSEKVNEIDFELLQERVLKLAACSNTT